LDDGGGEVLADIAEPAGDVGTGGAEAALAIAFFKGSEGAVHGGIGGGEKREVSELLTRSSDQSFWRC
jgi:hypothetical protein